MSARDMLNFIEALQGTMSRTNRESLAGSSATSAMREVILNRLRETNMPNRPSRSSDYFYDSYLEERDHGYGERRRERGRGHPSHQRHPMREMRMGRECGFDPYEDEYDYLRMRRLGHHYSRHSPERWKKPTSPPPTPYFRIRRDRNYVKIMELFDPVKREQRNKGVAIFIRGAPSSGKTILAKLIMEKEQSMGNRRIVYLTVNDYYQSPPGNSMMAVYREKMRKLAEEEFTKRSSEFYVIEVDGSSVVEFEKLYNLAMEKGNVTCYLIECQQSVETCLKYYNTRAEEMKEFVRLIDDEKPNDDVLLIDANEMYRRDRKKEQMIELMNKTINDRDYTSVAHKVPSRLEKLDNPYSRMKLADDFSDLATHVAELMKDPDILGLIEASVANISLKDDPETSKALEKISAVKPVKCFDYNHKPVITDEDVLFSFRPRITIDYNHRTTERLKAYIEDVNIDEIIAKRKSKNLRENVLKNYELAENPEETQSNPQYPKNWVKIHHIRPKPINKRKKVRNAKIEGCLKRIEENKKKKSMRRAKVATKL